MNIGPKKEIPSTILASRRILWCWNDWSYYSVNWYTIFLISNFRWVVNVVCFFLGNSAASEFYKPTFRNPLFHLHRQVGAEWLCLRNVGVLIRENLGSKIAWTNRKEAVRVGLVPGREQVIIMFKNAIVILFHNIIKANFMCESRCWL